MITENDGLSLEQVKNAISIAYLGKQGINGIGISRKDNAIVIYYERQNCPEQDALLANIKEKTAQLGFPVITKSGPPAQFSSGSAPHP